MFKHTIVAGTFDHLHSGHQKLLQTAINHSQKISCGLTVQKMTQKKSLASLIQSSHARYHQLNSFLSQQTSSYNIFPLNHPLQPAANSPIFDSIVASQETTHTVANINQLRSQNNLPSLKFIIINLLKSSDHQKLSSTRIRQGQINRQGFAYHQFFSKNKNLHLPALHRHRFRRPFDILLKGSQSNLDWAGLQAKKLIIKHQPFLIITVGDIATISLLQQNIKPNLAIVDLKTKRQQIFTSIPKLGFTSAISHTAINPPGKITFNLVKTLSLSLNTLSYQPSHHSILVKGEEDLSVLPTILLSPLKTAIFYGQPYQGLVYIKVTEKSKTKALKLLQKFT